MINIDSLTKTYPNKIALKNISLEINKGEVIAILGPSGSGKSTLLHCIAELQSYQGLIQRDVNAKWETGMVFQHFNLFSNMTILQNVCYAPIKVKKLDKQKAINKSLNILARVGLTDYADYYPHLLSGGQKQRAAIARTICMEPKIILFDEPTSALDPENVKEVLDVIRERVISMHLTTLIATHEIAFARKIADRIVFLENGQVIEVSSAAEFFAEPQSERAKVFLRLVEH